MTTESYMRRAIGYRRISKDRGDDGLGLSAQQKAIKDEAGRQELPLFETFTDNGVSGGARIEKRVELLAAISALRAGDTLIVAKRDRLARGDVLMMAWIEKEVAKRNARIVSAAGEGTERNDPTSILMRRIVDAFAEYERAIIRARTKAALATKKATGERYCCNAPFGHRWASDGRLAEQKAEQRTIALVHQLREQGLSYRQIVVELERRRRVNRAGKPFVLAQVQRILAPRVSRAKIGGVWTPV